MPRSWLLLAFAVSGCRTPTQIMVEVTTDFECSELTETSVTVGSLPGLETHPPITVTSQCRDRRVGALVIVPSGGKTEEVAIRVVAALGPGASHQRCVDGGYAGCIVARRVLRFIAHSELEVPIVMRLDCKNVPCGSDETCVDGTCRSARIADSTRCTTSNGCDEASLPRTPPSTVGGLWAKLPPVPTGFSGRAGHSAVWTGSEMIVWGGASSVAGRQTLHDDGAAYDPATNAWRLIATPSLAARTDHVGIWTGSEMIVWGGGGSGTTYLGDGAAYNPKTDGWRSLAKTSAPSARRTGGAWTGQELVVWGGYSGTPLDDGGAYDPKKDSWRPLPPVALLRRYAHAVAWDGTRVLVYGGYANAIDSGDCGSPAGPVKICSDGALFDPSSSTWTKLSSVPPLGARAYPTLAVSGPRLALFGGTIGDPYGISPTGAFTEGGASSFTAIPAATLLPGLPRRAFMMWWIDRRLFLWGGNVAPIGKISPEWQDDGASFDLAKGAWSTMPTGGPSRRGSATVVWTGKEAILWGGECVVGTLDTCDDGAIFRP